MNVKGKKVIGLILAAGIIGGTCTMDVSAGTYIDARNGNLGFSSSWERYTSGDSNRASLTYGFNTFLINEDYAWANHSMASHNAYVSNAKGGFAGPTKSAGSVSKIEVTHKGTSIHYMNHYSY